MMTRMSGRNLQSVYRDELTINFQPTVTNLASWVYVASKTRLLGLICVMSLMASPQAMTRFDPIFTHGFLYHDTAILK